MWQEDWACRIEKPCLPPLPLAKTMSLKTIVESTETKAGRIFDLSIQGLVVFSLITFSIETLPNLSQTARFWLRTCEIVTVSIFTIEYALRVTVADNKLRFIFSFYGLVDLLAIAPFYLRLGMDLRAVRVFRLFRLFRAFKFLRYSKAIQRFKRAFGSIKEELTLFLIATVFTIFLAAVGIYYFEGQEQPEQFGSIFHSLWWAVVTLSTVGYGDAYPVTVGGKVFTALLLIVGVGIVAVPSGLMASALTATKREEDATDSD